MKFYLKFKSFHLRKCTWKCCLPEWQPSCLASMNRIHLGHEMDLLCVILEPLHVGRTRRRGYLDHTFTAQYCPTRPHHQMCLHATLLIMVTEIRLNFQIGVQCVEKAISKITFNIWWNLKQIWHSWHTWVSMGDIKGPGARGIFLPEASFGLRVLSLPASVCLCVPPCVNHELVRAITHDPFQLGSPNLDHRCKRPWLRSLLFWGWLTLTSKVKFNFKVKIYPILSLSAR